MENTQEQPAMSFEEAMAQLEALTAKLERGEIDLAQLQTEIKQAQALIEFCRSQLFAVEKQVQEILPQEDGM